MGDLVYARNYGSGTKWIPGKVKEVTGPVSYKVELLQDGVVWRRHQDQLRKCHVDPSTLVSDSWEAELASAPFEFPSTTESSGSTDTNQEPVQESSTAEIVQPRHYPQRSRHPPDRYVEQCM